MEKCPYIFLDNDKWSETFGKYCVRVNDTYSIDGFDTEEDAKTFIESELNGNKE